MQNKFNLKNTIATQPVNRKIQHHRNSQVCQLLASLLADCEIFFAACPSSSNLHEKWPCLQQDCIRADTRYLYGSVYASLNRTALNCINCCVDVAAVDVSAVVVVIEPGCYQEAVSTNPSVVFDPCFTNLIDW